MTHIEQNGYTIGIGLTDRCNAACPHCYSRPVLEPHDIDYDKLVRLIETLPVKSVNFGTGESILYSQLIQVVELLSEKGVDVALTTNGTTVLDLPDEIVKLFRDIDFSIDFPDPITNDRWRGVGAYQCIMSGVERCQQLGVEASLVACLMKENSACMGRLATLAVEMDLNLRINVYKSVGNRAHQPSYEEFWSAIQDMADVAYFTACSEPVVCAAIGKKDGLKGNPCGQMSFRLHPDGVIVPCVYLMDSPVTIDDAIEDFEGKRHYLTEAIALKLPPICHDCEWQDACSGGCASRRILGNTERPDEYCFVERGGRPQINARWKESKGLVHENYLCTMIFTG